MRKSTLYSILLITLLLISCDSEDSITNSGIAIDINNLSTETLNGTWEIISDFDENGNEHPIGKEWIVYYDNCPEKPRGIYTKFENRFGIFDGMIFQKTHTKKEIFLYDKQLTCDTIGQSLETFYETINFDVTEITLSIIKDNKIYYEIRESNNSNGYYHSQFRLTFNDDKILYSFVDHLGKQSSAEDLTDINFIDFSIIKKTSNDVDLTEFNDGNNEIQTILFNPDLTLYNF